MIRPFLFVEEREIRQYARLAAVPVVDNPCPADRSSERARMKQLLRDLPVDNEMLRTNIFGAVKRDIWGN